MPGTPSSEMREWDLNLQRWSKYRLGSTLTTMLNGHIELVKLTGFTIDNNAELNYVVSGKNIPFWKTISESEILSFVNEPIGDDKWFDNEGPIGQNILSKNQGD